MKKKATSTPRKSTSDTAPAIRSARSVAEKKQDPAFTTASALAVGDPLPVNDGGLVKLGTATMTDTVFLLFAQTENAAMTGNPAYTTPAPAVADMATAITAYGDLLEQIQAAKLLLKQLVSEKDTARADLELMLKNRAAYVQLTSNGNTALILSAGFPVRATPSPVGILPPPWGLRVDLNGTVGKMLIYWEPVLNARNYLVQQASIVNGVRSEWTLIDVQGKTNLILNGMTVGMQYVFRVAAGGGSSGRSDWSPEVVRTAA